jgi:hypothetical protein
MCREIDVGDCSGVCMENVLNGILGLDLQIPDQRFLIRSAHNPIVPNSEGGPLHVSNFPRGMVRKVAGQRPGRIDVDDMKALFPRDLSIVFHKA